MFEKGLLLSHLPEGKEEESLCLRVSLLLLPQEPIPGRVRGGVGSWSCSPRSGHVANPCLTLWVQRRKSPSTLEYPGPFTDEAEWVTNGLLSIYWGKTRTPHILFLFLIYHKP